MTTLPSAVRTLHVNTAPPRHCFPFLLSAAVQREEGGCGCAAADKTTTHKATTTSPQPYTWQLARRSSIFTSQSSGPPGLGSCLEFFCMGNIEED